MATPIFAFWVCYRQMNRIIAQDTLRQFRLAAVVNGNEASRSEFVQDQIAAMGTVVKAKEPTQKEGIRRLKALAG